MGSFVFIPSDSADKNQLIKDSMNDCWTIMGGKSTQLKGTLSIPSLKIQKKVFFKPDQRKQENAKEEEEDAKQEMKEYAGGVFIDLPMPSPNSEPLEVEVSLSESENVRAVLEMVMPGELELMKKTIDFINFSVFEKLNSVQEK